MPELNILVVDDEPGMVEVCEAILKGIPTARVVGETRPREAARLMAQPGWDLLVTDLRMPELDGMELLRLGRQHHPDLPALILTAFPSVESAVESMKLGAADYLTKPFLPEEFLATAQRLLNARLARNAKRGRRQAEYEPQMEGIVGKSAAMEEVFDTIRHLADTQLDVLIVGETGTGKELVARAIHEHSNRRGGRFVPVDCGAIPEDLLESEFFGHERGAFTGAHAKSLGLLQFADRGTFFLDELGQLPLKLQSKLLRVLQERRVRRVGGNSESDIDVRVLAATSLNLEEEVREGRFRADLLYRINVAQVRLPPLRERDGDVPLLVEHFVDRYGREMNRDPIHIEATAMDALCGHTWPGNVRELQNVLKRAIAMARTHTITCDALPESIVGKREADGGCGGRGYFRLRDQHIARFERTYFESLLRECQGNISQAAEQAELPRGTFYRLINRHQIDPSAFRT
jgi:DNA-binding NtrC family response regulator